MFLSSMGLASQHHHHHHHQSGRIIISSPPSSPSSSSVTISSRDSSSAETKLKIRGWLNGLLKKKKKKKLMELGQEISGHHGSISAIKLSPDGRYIASAGEDGIVRIWSATHEVFHIDESPLHEFHGHTSQVLDIAWSSSNQVLSASMDSSVRLWQVGSGECVSVFVHVNYVTCVEFNPVDENYFISGSIDGKIRIWGVSENRVVDWADNSREIVSAVCYQPNARGFASGFLSGICRFYQLQQGTQPFVHQQINIKSRITGIKFLEGASYRMMITSEDSKIRILDGFDLVHKYQGPSKSGQHIVSVGDDSRIYKSQSCKKWCGYFDRFSLASWFSMDAALTWPEEKLPPPGNNVIITAGWDGKIRTFHYFGY